MGDYQREPEHCMAFDSIVTNGIIVRNILLLCIALTRHKMREVSP
jgi:hypothetical protein